MKSNIVLLAAVGACTVAAASAGCEMTGAPWVIGAKGMSNKLFAAIATGSDAFNITFGIRHGVAKGEGKVDGSTVSLTGDHNLTCTGTFDASCNTINWTTTSTKNRGCFNPSWCRAWTPGCVSPEPPYGEGFSFLSTLGSNMVLQQAPAKSAVYGIVVGKPTAVKVTVTDVTGVEDSYEVDATFNSTHQAFGPEFVGGDAAGMYPGPFQTWKAYLNPTKAGGNYTISAVCAGCTEDGSFSNINISNVAFGDVWHCSGQSNMWLPVGNAFGINDTLGNISAGNYNNIRVMAGNSGSGTTNPWMTAVQASVVPPQQGRGAAPHAPLLDFGAACWYFAEQLAKLGVTDPIGLSDTAIGGQRIEEYMVNDTTLTACSDRSGEASPEWNGRLYGEQTIPFVDMTVKGFVWYQGENNMGGVKGNSAYNIGYGCEQKALVDGWRKVWSETPGTTDPLAPFGIVTLASSGSEGGPDMGAMRLAQTANHGVLPNPSMPNTFLAQAYDLDDEWNDGGGPCTNPKEWSCCTYSWGLAGKATYNKTSCAGREQLCATACASTLTPPKMGGIHPRTKKPVGERLGTAAFNIVYGGKGAHTGPTLSGCTYGSTSLTIEFNSTLLAGDTLEVRKIPPIVPSSSSLLGKGEMSSAGSQLYLQINASLFCIEQYPAKNSTGGNAGYNICPEWAGGDGKTAAGTPLDTQWINVNYTKATDNSITVDLAPLNGSVPTAVQYAWGVVDCCDHSDPNLYVTHGCAAACPLMSSSNLPANPFKAKIVGGKCECVAPQVC